MKISEVALKLSDNNTPAKKFVDAMYAKYPSNPMNNKEFGMVYDEGQSVALFELTTSFKGPDWVEIKFVHAFPQGKGVGKRGMIQLQNEAKQAGINLELFAWDKSKTPLSKLKKFYISLGFKASKGDARQFAWTSGAK